ncbi:unnamed protein product [Trichogramma brassicae]|uniref:Uncharacterized protein n=1 Tax=Trichogramma brassicae TaxID=86971 RepID=A0A6H5J6P3_9HYME|nr:unnamed protein product [Trichogramma brassicae]
MATTAARGTAPAAAAAAATAPSNSSIIIRPTIIITRTRARLALLLRRPMIKHATSSSSSRSRKLVIRYCYVNATRLSYHYMRFENLYIFTIITVCDMPIDICKKKRRRKSISHCITMRRF